MIQVFTSRAKNGENFLKKLLFLSYKFDKKLADVLVNQYVKEHFENLNEDCFLVSEYPYVDKVHRDSYYSYYSSKQNHIPRDCIRISIFSKKIRKADFRIRYNAEKIRENYLGFLVIRPTFPHIIGRSAISPRALKDDSFLCCRTKIDSTTDSLKVSVEAFPHSSQDKETMSCAETTVWAIMEYFGTKYPEFRPVLPSTIINVLKRLSNERQVPSRGLDIHQISFSLKEFGFGPRIYSRSEFGKDFSKLFSAYVESGIPVVVAIDNRKNGGDIGHAAICIGRKVIDDSQVDALKHSSDFQIKDDDGKLIGGSRSVYDFGDIKHSFIFIDDNCPAYQKAKFDFPTLHYSDPKWHNCTINHFIVPLYPKVYLEAFEAKKFVKSLINKNILPRLGNNELLIRFFLTSSRSYKEYLLLSEDIESNFRDLILESPCGKFIWVAELTTKELFKAGKISGLILLDATEANVNYRKPLIIMAFDGKMRRSDDFEELDLSLQPFIMYLNNLKESRL